MPRGGPRSNAGRPGLNGVGRSRVITVRLDDETVRDLDLLAQYMSCSLSEAIRSAIICEADYVRCKMEGDGMENTESKEGSES